VSQTAILTTATTIEHQPAGQAAPRMLIKRVLWTLLITGVIGTATTVTQAQSVRLKPWPRGASVANPAPAVPDLIVPSAPAAAAQGATKRAKKAIVGSWLGTSGEGNRLITSFTSDGIVLSSVQTEVSTNPELGVLTPGHGAWTHVGGRQFEFTLIGVLYTIDTGEYLGYLKARGSLTLNEAGDQLSGTDKVEIFAPDGSLVFAVPPGPLQFTRISAEPFE
jgi:hypothetical protein